MQGTAQSFATSIYIPFVTGFRTLSLYRPVPP